MDEGHTYALSWNELGLSMQVVVSVHFKNLFAPFLRAVCICCIGMFLSGCGTDQYQTPDLVRANDGFMHRKFTFEGSYKEAVERLQARTHECLSRQVRSHSSGPRGISVRLDYTPTLKVGENHTELYLQMKHGGNSLVLHKEPEQGLYMVVADLKELVDNQLAGEIHYQNGLGGYGGMGNYAAAIEGWMRGTHMLCPN